MYYVGFHVLWNMWYIYIYIYIYIKFGYHDYFPYNLVGWISAGSLTRPFTSQLKLRFVAHQQPKPVLSHAYHQSLYWPAVGTPNVFNSLHIVYAVSMWLSLSSSLSVLSLSSLSLLMWLLLAPFAECYIWCYNSWPFLLNLPFLVKYC